MEAGLEHLSRSGGTLAYADVLLVIMEPSRKSILTAGRTIVLAEELGLKRVYGVGNKARPGDEEFFETVAAEYNVPLAGTVPEDDEVAEADRSGTVLGEAQGPAVWDAVRRIVDFVDRALVDPTAGPFLRR